MFLPEVGTHGSGCSGVEHVNRAAPSVCWASVTGTPAAFPSEHQTGPRAGAFGVCSLCAGSRAAGSRWHSRSEIALPPKERAVGFHNLRTDATNPAHHFCRSGEGREEGGRGESGAGDVAEVLYHSFCCWRVVH